MGRTRSAERYVATVLEPIAENQRSEVRTEIRGAIGEMVGQRIEAGEPEDVAVRAALNELGDPARLAASYSDRQQYLIGPGWYPSYINQGPEGHLWRGASRDCGDLHGRDARWRQ